MSTPTARMSVAQRLARLNALSEAERQPGILVALEDESHAVRECAIRLATRHVEPAVLGELAGDESNATRRNAALAALERQGPYAVPHLQLMLRQDNVDLAMFALQVLSRIGDPAAAPAIFPLLQHPDLNVAQSAVEALGQLRSVEAVPPLLELLGRELWIQLAAIDALGAIGDPRAVAPLIELVPDSIVAEPAIHALQRLAAPESLEPLLDRLAAVEERSLRDALLLATGVVIDLHPDPGPIANDFFRRLAEERADGMRGYLEQALGATTPPGATGDLADLLRAGTTLVVVARLESLFPLVLIRIASPEGAAWAEALFRRYPEALRPALDQLLAADDPRVRRGALLAGSLGADDLPRILPHLGDSNPGVRAAACRALGQAGAVEVAPLLVERLRAGEPIEHAAAAEGLALLPAEALQELETCLLPEMGEAVRIRALDVLAIRPSRRFEAQIFDLTGAKQTALRRAALRAAAALPGPRAEVVLIRALADRNQPVQLEALELLVRRGGGKAATTLVALLGTGDSLRYHVIRALGHLQAREAAGKLIALYSECGPHERLEVVGALSRIGAPGIRQFLRARLDESETDVRRVAAQGLAELADPAELPLLLSLAGDPDWNVRNEAARGLGLLALPEGRGALLTLVRDEEPVVARTARTALDRLTGDPARTPA